MRNCNFIDCINAFITIQDYSESTIIFTLARLGNLASMMVWDCCSLKCEHIFGFYYKFYFSEEKTVDLQQKFKTEGYV